MARSRLHSDDSILDATRDLLVKGGAGAATASAISAASGAPIGSLYHRFGSRTRLFAEVWLRTVSRFQDGLLAAAHTGGTGIERAIAAADWVVEFAARYPAESRLLLHGSREHLLTEAELPTETRQALVSLNQPVTELLHRLTVEVFGTATPQLRELLTIAVIDVPYAFVRRHLHDGTSPEPYRQLIAGTVHSLLRHPTDH
ncbi:TetR/AcrR family transcriptional regulator [Amycolatopsis taiwanensis]|uniref:TetR/AcrR family transcriptional regulator n=1 Tax=Amycolatopsis taiwanensis TaxID=342230 RepID=UPI000482C4D6|nr:TetR family transcriptional regulator [Amycolatopsis taiwanensis]